MSREDLIDRLSAGLAPVRRRRPRLDAAMLLALAVAEFALVVRVGLMRPDMPHAMGLMSFWWKLVSLAVIATIGAATSVLSFDPAGSPKRGLRVMLAVLVATLASGWLVDAAHDGTAALLVRLDWREGIVCAGKIVALSLPPIVAFAILMRRGAPTEPGATALAVGATSAAWGAFVFVFACPHDDPLYLAVWYALGCGVVTVFARLALPRLTNW